MKNKHYYFLAVLAAFSLLLFCTAFAGCDSNKPLSMLLQESTKPTNETASDLVDCYKDIGTDAENNEYLLAFDKSCVDALLTDNQQNAESITLPPGVKSTELATIVEDVAADNTSFLYAWIYVRASVISDLTDGGRTLSLETDNDSVNFRVSSFVKKSQLSRWTKGNSYNFILFINAIEHKPDTGITTIFSRVDDPDNIAVGRSVLTPTTSNVIPTSVNELLESFRKGESYYIGKRVSFLDTVKDRQDNQVFESQGTTYDRLVVYSERVSLFATGRDRFSIYPTLKLFDGEIDEEYAKGSFHNFVVTIHYLSGEDFFNPNKVRITGYFEDKTFLPIP